MKTPTLLFYFKTCNCYYPCLPTFFRREGGSMSYCSGEWSKSITWTVKKRYVSGMGFCTVWLIETAMTDSLQWLSWDWNSISAGAYESATKDWAHQSWSRCSGICTYSSLLGNYLEAPGCSGNYLEAVYMYITKPLYKLIVTVSMRTVCTCTHCFVSKPELCGHLIQCKESMNKGQGLLMKTWKSEPD